MTTNTLIMNIKFQLSIFAVFLFHILPSLALAELKPLDKIIVVVDEGVITQTMLDNRVNDFKKQLELNQLSRIDPETLTKQVLERMIRDTIQLQKAKQFGITVDDLMLNRMLERMAQGNQMTLDAFRENIEKEELSYTRFREQTRNELIINQLQQRLVASKINVSDQEVQQYIEQSESGGSSSIVFQLRHILIAIPETSSPEDLSEAKEKADSVYKKISLGSKFEDMAIKYSNGRNALKGGDLGKRKANELPQIFVDAVKNLNAGETSKPFKSASGFHLLQLVSSSNDSVMVQQTNARHILLRTSNEVNNEQARKILLELKQKIEDGKSFAEIASEYSEDPTTKIKGGDLGWYSPGEFVPAFEDVANSLDIGQISEPFKTPFGWHILEALERRQHDQSKSNKENQARNTIKKRKIDEELRLWLRRIRDEAYVEFIDDDS
ncbi:Periplasmic chaperone and peptidyl-prolyl cis-trans isomerase of outer membrane proteins SurA [hydrothermal vent metagenome]|uniref:Periplasmic chaperone and peptidyl-prolyl cis-trans isomerase of outer membrane proteins SurA n=1 Tax=hydrothermal vent metagenome TaxID=652676 RepID=A0A3B0W977_9ZZZZ